MVVIRRVWWSETRLEFETWRAASERDAEVAAWDFTTYTEGKKKSRPCASLYQWLSSWSACGCVAGRDEVLFILVIEDNCPGPALDWTAGHGVNSFLHAQKGSGGREAWQGGRRNASPKNCTGSQKPTCSSRDELLSPPCRPPPKISWISPLSFSASFVATGSQVSASSCDFIKPPVAPVVLKSKSQHDCRATLTLSTQLYARQRRMLLLPWVGIGRAHVHECCQVCKSPVSGLRPGLDPLMLKLFINTNFISHGIQVCSDLGITNDLIPDLGGLYFDNNSWRTCQIVLGL